LGQAGLLPQEWTPALSEWAAGLVPIVRNYIHHYAQIPDRCASVFFRGGRPQDEAARQILASPEAVKVVRVLGELAEQHPPVDLESWQAIKRGVKERAAVKGKALFRPLRVAVSGLESGPELDLLVPLVERGHGIVPDRIERIAGRARRILEWLDED
jgi:glutamyl/glutaminyl-tRNA synthetase